MSKQSNNMLSLSSVERNFETTRTRVIDALKVEGFGF